MVLTQYLEVLLLNEAGKTIVMMLIPLKEDAHDFA